MSTASLHAVIRRFGAWPWLVVLLVVMGFAFQGARPLWEPDEGRYTAVALQMLESGDLLFPRLNDDQSHLTKPPLAYWAIAASVAIFGRTAWAIRMPYAVCFILTGLLVYALAIRFVPERPWLPTLLWGTSLLPLLAANVVNTDTILALFETFAVFAFVASHSAYRPRNWLTLMWFALALGFMTKGPPALLPLLPIIVWTWTRQGRQGTASLFPWSGLLVFAMTGTSWFAWLFIRQPELLGYFFGYELVDRIFSNVHHRNPEWYGAFKIYLPVLLLCALPWLFMTWRWPRALWNSFRLSTWRRRLNDDPDGVFLALWLLLPLIVFFFARSRLFLYVLPLTVPIVLLIGRELSRSFSGPLPNRWRRGLIVWTLFALAVKGVLMHLPSRKDAAAEARQLSGHLGGADRIVYIGERAHYGLRFYTGLPVIQFDSVVGKARMPSLAQESLCLAANYAPNALLITAPGAITAAPDCKGIRLANVGSDLWRTADAITSERAASRVTRIESTVQPSKDVSP